MGNRSRRDHDCGDRFQQESLSLLRRLVALGEKMSPELEDLRKHVTEIESASASAVSMLQGLSQIIKEAANNPVEIRRISAEIGQAAQELSKAVVDNTPAADDQPPVPGVVAEGKPTNDVPPDDSRIQPGSNGTDPVNNPNVITTGAISNGGGPQAGFDENGNPI